MENFARQDANYNLQNLTSIYVPSRRIEIRLSIDFFAKNPKNLQAKEKLRNFAAARPHSQRPGQWDKAGGKADIILECVYLTRFLDHQKLRTFLNFVKNEADK